MKIQFRMTLSSLHRESGAHTAEMGNASGDRSLALSIRRLYPKEAESFAPLYNRSEAIRVTFSTEDDAPALTRDTQDKLQEHRSAHSYLDSLSAPRDLHGAPLSISERIARIPRDAAPPLIDGRPSCCVKALANLTPSADVLALHAIGLALVWPLRSISGNCEARMMFCPFCGAKLPEVTP